MKHAGTFTNIIKRCWFEDTIWISTSQHSITPPHYYIITPLQSPNAREFEFISPHFKPQISSNKETELMRKQAPSGNTKRRRGRRSSVMLKGTLSTHFMVSLKPSRFQNSEPQSDSMPLDFDADDKDFILSQDFFWSKFFLFSSVTISELSV